MKTKITLLTALCIAAIGMTSTSAAADEKVAAMITRIEPADTGIARVTGDDRDDEAAFMMSLYDGDVLTVETPNTVVYVKIFGGDKEIARKGEPLKIGEAAEERGLFSSIYAAAAEKVFRNNQLYRRNLTTRSDGDDVPLVLSGFSGEHDVQNIKSGNRSLFFRWNADLDSADYEMSEVGGRAIASGKAEGDFLFIDDIDLVAENRYKLRLRSPDGREAVGVFQTVSTMPSLPPVEPELGTVGEALRLIGLAQHEEGQWKFEAIQGVVELSPDDIDRATLIDEISLL